MEGRDYRLAPGKWIRQTKMERIVNYGEIILYLSISFSNYSREVEKPNINN